MKVEQIIECVAKNYCIKPESLKIKSPPKYIVEPRYVIIHLLKNIYGVKPKQIVKTLGISETVISRSWKHLNKKFQDDDFVDFINKIRAEIDKGEENRVNIFERDLKSLLKRCKKRGDCLVLDNLQITGRGLGNKYNLHTANQLYFLLTTGQYPGRTTSNKMEKFCSTKNCIKHWETDITQEFIAPNAPLEEITPVSGEEKLIYAVIESAVDEKDFEYFKSSEFDKHLRCLGVENKQKILQFLKKKAII